MITRFRSLFAAAFIVVIVLGLLAPAAASAVPRRASLVDVENDVMCVICNEPLALSQAPEADQERSVIRALIAKGDTKAQIERQLVAQYGPAVLGRPPAHGFNLTVYVLPPAVVLIGLAILALALPRWRRRAEARRLLPAAGVPALDPAEQHRLEDELSRYGG
jgi:cytochrome c-type biogenesis protein CcmH